MILSSRLWDQVVKVFSVSWLWSMHAIIFPILKKYIQANWECWYSSTGYLPVHGVWHLVDTACTIIIITCICAVDLRTFSILSERDFCPRVPDGRVEVRHTSKCCRTFL